MKSFTRADSSRATGPEFELNGHVFRCRRELPAGTLMNLMRVMSEVGGGDDATPGQGQTAAAAAQANSMNVLMAELMRFFKVALRRSDYQLWRQWIDGPTEEQLDAAEDDEEFVVVGLEELTDISGYLAGEYSARPTGESSSEPSSPRSGGDDSTVGVSPGALTYSRSEQHVPALSSSTGSSART